MNNAHTALLLNSTFGTDTSFIQKQVIKGAKFFADFIAQLSTIEQLKAVTENQKGVKRYTQCVNFALTGDSKAFDAVSAYMISGIVLTKDKTITYQNAHFMCGVGSDNASNIRGISRAKLARFLGDAGTAGTVSSKVSRTTGKNGFFTALGITTKSDKHSFTLTDNAKNHALVLAYAHQLERMTESTFLSLTAKKNK